METRSYNVYTFDELTEEQQQKAIEKYWDINVDYEWWDFVYEDASEIGLKISGFDIGRGNDIAGGFTETGKEVALRIFKNHGKHCETYQDAKKFMVAWTKECQKIKKSDSFDYSCDELSTYCFDELAEVENDFKKALLETYLVSLRKEYEYFTTEDAIIETLKANEYMFKENGEID